LPGAKLVRCDRDEVRLQPVEQADLLVQARALDRERDANRHELEQLDVVRVKVRPLRGADVQDADHFTAYEQRHAEH
jgi:hypothetical protein